MWSDDRKILINVRKLSITTLFWVSRGNWATNWLQFFSPLPRSYKKSMADLETKPRFFWNFSPPQSACNYKVILCLIALLFKLCFCYLLSPEIRNTRKFKIVEFCKTELRGFAPIYMHFFHGQGPWLELSSKTKKIGCPKYRGIWVL